MVEVTEKKRYGGLMTEHERRVNDKDIKAYEENDTNHLHGKLPGFGGAYEAERQRAMVQRSIGNSSPMQFSNNADIMISNGVKTTVGGTGVGQSNS